MKFVGVGFYQGYTSDFDTFPNSDILACKDELLEQDWSTFSTGLKNAIIARINDLPTMTTEEINFLEAERTRITIIDMAKYSHILESAVDHDKLFYLLGDSLFGRTFASGIIPNVHPDAFLE
jgi:hypothetical protein